MFAASQGPIINLDAIPWHWIFHVVLMVLAFAFMLVVCIGVVIAVARSEGGVKQVVKAVEADAEKIIASPVGRTVVSDVKSLAAALAKELQTGSTPVVDMPNHPLVTAAIDIVQQNKATQETLAKVAALSAQASAAATAPAK